MGKITHHNPPNRIAYRFQQIVALIGIVLILIAMPLLIVIAMSLNGPLLLFAVPMLALLMLPLLHMMNASPPVSVDDTGLTLHPFLLRERFIPWEAITDLRDYPLLPNENHETLRKFVVEGRKQYRAPRGQMLVVPGLPWPYRMTGLLAGADGKPVIALTSRSHNDYDVLIDRVKRSLPNMQHAS